LERIEHALTSRPMQVGPAMPHGELPAVPVYLQSWREILDCLKLKNDKTRQNQVRQANDQYAGPIHFPGRGAQRKVNKAKLIEWWCRLEILWDTQGGEEDAEATVKARHNYGRDGTVVPNISGHVQKRRGKNGARSPTTSRKITKHYKTSASLFLARCPRSASGEHPPEGGQRGNPVLVP
jgi:hypothetical protein